MKKRPGPPVRCAGCAFTPGTEANRWPLITFQAQCCVETMASFYCHEGPEPKAGKHRPLCVGWMEAIQARYAKGLPEPSDDRRVALLECIRVARVAEEELGFDTDDHGARKAARRIVRVLRRTLP